MRSFFSWLKNSTKIKRWIFLMLIGMVLACFGFAQILVSDTLLLTDIIKIIATFVAGITLFIVGLVFIQKSSQIGSFRFLYKLIYCYGHRLNTKIVTSTIRIHRDIDRITGYSGIFCYHFAISRNINNRS